MAKKRVGTVDEQVEEILIELRLYGFAAVKEIARLRGQTSGAMNCPLCGQHLRFSIAASNGHLAARCERPGCLAAME